MILVTGPTGSGKTTTLYAALREITSPARKIITIEDPVEYQIPGVIQIQVKPQIGLTFASGLRSIVRQDPDVILVGEIRDRETAEIAIHSALTGHMVLSTLHTNDAPGAVTRLLEMGVEEYLLPSVLVGVLAQRLVRTICEGCAAPRDISPALREEVLREAGFVPEGNLRIGRRVRCLRRDRVPGTVGDLRAAPRHRRDQGADPRAGGRRHVAREGGGRRDAAAAGGRLGEGPAGDHDDRGSPAGHAGGVGRWRSSDTGSPTGPAGSPKG